MNNDDLKRIKAIIVGSVKPLKALAEVTNSKVKKTEIELMGLSASLHLLRDRVDVINDKLDEHTEKLNLHTAKLDEHTAKLDNHTQALIEIETTLKGYGDMYKVNGEKIGELAARVEKVEEQLGISSN